LLISPPYEDGCERTLLEPADAVRIVLTAGVAVHFFTYRFIMFERFHSIIVLSLSLEQRLCITPPSILTLCSFASLFRLLRRSNLTAVMLDLRFSHFYLGALLALPYIVCLFYRWREFGDITIIGSYYGVPIIQ
jgi:hypothetical protein